MFYLILFKVTKAEKVIFSYYYEENPTLFMFIKKKMRALSTHEDANTGTAWSTHVVFLLPWHTAFLCNQDLLKIYFVLCRNRLGCMIMNCNEFSKLYWKVRITCYQ